MTHAPNGLQIAIWATYGGLIVGLLAMLVWGAKVAIKDLAGRYRDPIGPLDYGERHSDWDGDGE